MSVLLIAETNGDTLVTDATAKALTAAAKLGEVTVLVAAADASAAAAEAATLQGTAKVVAVSEAALGHGLAEPHGRTTHPSDDLVTREPGRQPSVAVAAGHDEASRNVSSLPGITPELLDGAAKIFAELADGAHGEQPRCFRQSRER